MAGKKTANRGIIFTVLGIRQPSHMMKELDGMEFVKYNEMDIRITDEGKPGANIVRKNRFPEACGKSS